MPKLTREQPFTQIPDWVILHPDLSHATIRVYAAICTHVNKERVAFPGVRRIAEVAHCSPYTVQTALKELETVGAIQVTRSKNSKGENKPNLYHLPLQGVPATSTRMPTTGTGGGPTSGTELYPSITTPIEQHQESEAHSVEVVEIDGQPYDVEISPGEILDGSKDHHDAIAYALVSAMSWKTSEVSEPQWGKIHKAALTLTNLGVHPAEVAVRARVYQVNHPEWELTPNALAAWWADSSQARLKPSKGQVADISAAAERRTWRNQ